MSKRGFPARPGWAPCIVISLLITMTPDLARAHARRGVGSVGAAFGLLGQTKNGFGDGALTDTGGCLQLRSKRAGVPAIARIVTSCFLRRAWSRAAPQQAPKA